MSDKFDEINKNSLANHNQASFPAYGLKPALPKPPQAPSTASITLENKKKDRVNRLFYLDPPADRSSLSGL